MWMYIVVAVLGAAVGWYLVQYRELKMSMALSIVLGIVGGLLGGLIANLLSSIAVILFKLILGAAGGYFVVFFVQRYLASKSGE